MMDYGLKDRVVIVTGANNPQGIGAATFWFMLSATAEPESPAPSSDAAHYEEQT